MTNIFPFHLAIPVNNLEAARHFYRQVLGCGLGRETKDWIDFDFFGHQLSLHLKPEETVRVSTNTVDGKNVPVRHFGVVLTWEVWHALAEKIKQSGIAFIIAPHIRFKGEAGEQATMFFSDPSGNMLEFKSFRNISQLFAK